MQNPVGAHGESELKVAYVLRRYPVLTETFIIREVAELSQTMDLTVFPLWATRSTRDGGIHGSLTGNVDRRATDNLAGGIRALLFWLRHRPRRVLAAMAACLWANRSSTRDLLVALACLPQALLLARIVREEDFAHVHTHFATQSADVARLISHLADVTWSFTPHAYDLFKGAPALGPRIDDAAFVVAISSFHRGFLRAWSGDETRHPIVHCGLEVDDYPFDPPEQTEGTPIIVCVAAFTAKKGHEYLLTAMREFSSAGRHARLRLIGTGVLEEALRKQVAELGISDSVEFLGPLSQEEVRAEVSRADVLVQPSVVAGTGDSEGLPVSILEAMALGTPVVASDVAAIGEVVRPDETGTLISARDPASLVEALVWVLGHHAATREMAFRARDLIEREFAIGTTASRLQREFERAVGAG